MSNIDISGGSIKTKKDEIIIRSNNRKNTAEEINKIVIQSNVNGGIVRLEDVAFCRNEILRHTNKIIC